MVQRCLKTLLAITGSLVRREVAADSSSVFRTAPDFTYDILTYAAYINPVPTGSQLPQRATEDDTIAIPDCTPFDVCIKSVRSPDKCCKAHHKNSTRTCAICVKAACALRADYCFSAAGDDDFYCRACETVATREEQHMGAPRLSGVVAGKANTKQGRGVQEKQYRDWSEETRGVPQKARVASKPLIAAKEPSRPSVESTTTSAPRRSPARVPRPQAQKAPPKRPQQASASAPRKPSHVKAKPTMSPEAMARASKLARGNPGASRPTPSKTDAGIRMTPQEAAKQRARAQMHATRAARESSLPTVKRPAPAPQKSRPAQGQKYVPPSARYSRAHSSGSQTNVKPRYAPQTVQKPAQAAKQNKHSTLGAWRKFDL